MLRETGYTLEDVSKALSNYILSFNLKLTQNGINVPLKIVVDTPDIAISARTYPSIFINPGFVSGVPEAWERERSITDQEFDEDNPSILKTNITQITNMNYSYQIGFLVEYSTHRDIMLLKFATMFSRRFFLCFKDVAEQDDHRLEFKHDGKVIPLDFTENNKKIFRRDIILTTRISLEDNFISEEETPYGEVELENINL